MTAPFAWTSLKSMTPILAQWTQMTPAALYERQRALVRAGLLSPDPGRGPGSGVRATPESVAMLLMALLATGSLSETAECTKILANLKSENQRCPLTGKKTLGSALTAVLTSSETAKRVGWIEVDRDWRNAVIAYAQRPRDKAFLRSAFGHHRIGLIPGLSEKAELFLPFSKIAEELAADTEAPKS